MVKLFNQLAHGFGVTAFGRLSQPIFPSSRARPVVRKISATQAGLY